MRCFRPLCARKDIVELLVRQGRLADIQMLNFFSIQLDREVGAAAQAPAAAAATAAASAAATPEAPASNAAVPPKTAAVAATPTTAAEAPAEGTTAVEDAAAKLQAEETAKAAAKAAKIAHSREVKKKAWTAFHDRSNAVRQLATNESPVAWLKEVYAKGDEWSSSYLSSAHAVATAAAGDATTLCATGVATAVGCGEAVAGEAAAVNASATPSLPASIRVVLRMTGDAADTAAAPTFVTASVRLDQPGVVEKQLVNGMLRVRLNNAEATRNESLSAKQVAGYQHVLTATAYSAILRKMEEVCALHATNAVRYDALLIRNPAVQMRLSQLTCFRYGIDCLTDYVIGDPDVEEGEEVEEFFHNFAALLQMPLIESMALNIYAERALMDGMDGMWEMVRDTPLIAAVPHRSKPEKMIDYPYLSQLLNSSKYLLTASDGSMEEQALTFLGPLLAHGGAFGTASGSSLSTLVQRLSGLTSGGGGGYGGVRLAAPHVNLSGMARQLEQDVARLLQMVSTEPEKTEPTFVICVAQYISEVLANLAVIYRCTAALNIDEAGRGHREWLLAQAFGGSSATRRQRLLDDYRMSRAVTKVLRRSKDLDNYSTHPIELMNASASSSRGSSGGAAGAKKAAAGGKAE